jgi:hypothetical protein
MITNAAQKKPKVSFKTYFQKNNIDILIPKRNQKISNNTIEVKE